MQKTSGRRTGRRGILLTGLLGALQALGALPRDARAAAPERTPLRFPRDFGSHPDWRTEWWYLTGHAQAQTTDVAREFGFQITFFRSRVDATQSLRSAFAARQLIFAHAALTDLQGGRLLHDQRIARAGMGVAQASEHDTAIRLRDWSLVHDADAAYVAHADAEGFALDLRCAPTQPPLLQGDAGFSRKGPQPDQFSRYYSEPQLQVQGRITLERTPFEVAGRAWLDHEWSETLMDPQAVGWDWTGMNLLDGGALTAFRLRRRDGSTLWAGGSLRTADGRLRVFRHDEVRFEPQRVWQSPATGARYPVQCRLLTPAGQHTIRARLDGQELDSRASTGTIYWEGLSDLLDARGAVVGRGYLELTGYAQALRL